MSEPIKIIEDILKSAYSTEGFVAFVKEIFDSIKIIAPDKKNKEYSNFNSHIETYSHIGSYTSPDGKKIAVFEVQLKAASYVENARSTQRSYARKLIENGNVDGAIIAFFTPNDAKWRLSFVRLDYEMKFEGGKFKTKENLTPAKRYSFLVGKDEPCHTAISRFHNFIIDKNYNPTLDEIEEAFSVEKVTKEFFDLYCEKFYQLQEYLESNRDFKEESERCGFTSEQFAKKLMGQIVFLYFLQKKGWLGVGVWPRTLTEKEYKNVFFTSGAQGRIIKDHLPNIYVQLEDGLYHLNSRVLDEISDEDEEVIANHMPRAKTWGDGSKNFLRTIYSYSQTHKKHFYEEYLEPLFYDTLNRNRGAMGYCPALHCRVPFLSGGLFDPIDNYDWKNNYFDIPDEIFSNKKDDNDRDADGILDIFDRYNFTMSEDEPMEREVAIDPEMLGKVFENLLEVKDRKSKGAFYTPREIVHYMCQESLINYLVRKTGLKETDIRDFILYGDFMKDEDTTKEKREGNGGMYISDEIFKIDADGKIVVNRLAEIDEALANVKVADPAVGSGAFPLGMMNEIVRARQNITAYMSIGMNAYNKRMLYQNDRSPYILKYNTIKNCLYAVDIEPSAVDIAQLRLWLSLVIDDEINPNAQNDIEGHRDPLPLPNLECNILCGNSLIDEFQGVKLVKPSDILGTMKTNYQLDFGQNDFEFILKKMLEEQNLLFRCDDPIKKLKHKETIQSYKDMIVSKEVLGNPTFMEEYKKATAMSSKPFIVWELDFARVFRDNGGFDIVVGNPPYVDSEEMVKSMPEMRDLYSSRFSCAKGNWDLFVLFIEKGMDLRREGGVISYIVPNKLVAAPYTEAIRKKISKENVDEFRDYSNVNVFKSAAVYPVVFRVSSTTRKSSVVMDVMEDMHNIRQHNEVPADKFYSDIDWDRYFSSTKESLEIIEKVQKYPCLETLADVNGAATVGEAYLIKEIMYDNDRDADGVKFFINTGGIDPYRSFYGVDPIRYLKGSYMHPAVRIEDLRKISQKRLDESNKEKIIIGGMTKRLECYWDNGEYLAGKSTTIVYNHKHLRLLTAILNSNLMTFYYSVFFNSMSLAGGFYRIGAPQIKKLPIAMPTDESTILSIEEKVSSLQVALSNSSFDEAKELSKAINQDIYAIYGITKEEIAIIETKDT